MHSSSYATQSTLIEMDLWHRIRSLWLQAQSDFNWFDWDAIGSLDKRRAEGNEVLQSRGRQRG